MLRLPPALDVMPQLNFNCTISAAWSQAASNRGRTMVWVHHPYLFSIARLELFCMHRSLIARTNNNPGRHGLSLPHSPALIDKPRCIEPTCTQRSASFAPLMLCPLVTPAAVPSPRWTCDCARARARGGSLALRYSEERHRRSLRLCCEGSVRYMLPRPTLPVFVHVTLVHRAESEGIVPSLARNRVIHGILQIVHLVCLRPVRLAALA